MPYRLTFLLYLFLFLNARAQPSDTLSVDSLLRRQNPQLASLAEPGRPYLVLDVIGLLGGFQRHRFFRGQEIKFRYEGRRFKEPIYSLTDTSLALVIENPDNLLREVRHFRLDRIQRVYLKRQIPFVTQGAYFLPIAGALFLAADFVNPKDMAGNGRFITSNEALLISGALAGLGWVCGRLSNPSYRINRNHRLRVLRSR